MSLRHYHLTGETYRQHLWFAFKLSLHFIKMGVALMIHAAFPNWKRFDNRLKPFSEDLQKTVVTREMMTVHTKLSQRVEERLEQEMNNSPDNGT